MPFINSYSFGRIVVDGTAYHKDIIIFPDNSILCPWWRKSGHKLEVNDIETMITMNPDIIIAGTGSSGLMQPTDELQQLLRDKDIDFIALRTAESLDPYNEMSKKRRICGCFHITC